MSVIECYAGTSCSKMPKQIFNDLILRRTLIATLNKFDFCLIVSYMVSSDMKAKFPALLL